MNLNDIQKEFQEKQQAEIDEKQRLEIENGKKTLTFHTAAEKSLISGTERWLKRMEEVPAFVAEIKNIYNQIGAERRVVAVNLIVRKAETTTFREYQLQAQASYFNRSIRFHSEIFPARIESNRSVQLESVTPETWDEILETFFRELLKTLNR